MPTIAGLRRRGVPPEAIRQFIASIGVAKANSVVDVAMFNHAIREVLNKKALRRMAVMRPLKVVIENFPEDQTDMLEGGQQSGRRQRGYVREVPFTREIYVERDDFMEDPPKKFFRLSPGREVRLRYAYFITCTDVIKNEAGEVVELHCTYDPATRGGNAPDGRKVKATLHWVSVAHAKPVEARLYDHLFARPDPGADGPVLEDINPDALEVVRDCQAEPAVAETPAGQPIQFERLGYFMPDPDSTTDLPVFNRTVGLRDGWARAQAKGKGAG